MRTLRNVLTQRCRRLSTTFAAPPPPPRSARHAIVTDADLTYFRDICDVRTDDLDAFSSDWMRRWTSGRPPALLLPKTTRDVSKILAYCNDRRIAVVPQGGNTGLVGGSVPMHDEIVLGLSKMNAVESFDRNSLVLKAQAGCVLQDLDDYLAERGFAMPIDLGAKGSCQIGGNVSTNAGGLRYVRYGSLKDTVHGLEVVTANGDVLNLKMDTSLRKDNTGYDLKQLFIGAEGTLGVITRVAIRAVPRPRSRQIALLAVSSFDDVRETLYAAREGVGEILSAIEFMDAEAYRFGSSGRAPLNNDDDDDAAFYVLIETSGANATHDREKLEAFLETWMTSTPGRNGVVAQDSAQADQLWGVRENVGPACSNVGLVYKYDLSLPLDSMYDIVEIARERLASMPSVKGVVGYGHVGDQNLHLNVVVDGHDPEVLGALEPFVFDWTTQQCGSVSAEHGVGLCKSDYLFGGDDDGGSTDAAQVAIMRTLKDSLDPRGILNPYKVLG